MQPIEHTHHCYCEPTKAKTSYPTNLGCFIHPLRAVDMVRITRVTNHMRFPELNYKNLYSATLQDGSTILVTKAYSFTLCVHVVPQEDGSIEIPIDPFYADLVKIVWKERMNCASFRNTSK